MTASTWGVALVHYDNWPTVMETIADVAAQTAAPPSIAVVVDNSAPRTAMHLQRDAVGWRVVVPPDNLGFAGGANVALGHVLDAGCDTVLMLTHEVRLEPGAVETMIAGFEGRPDVGIVAPLVGYRDDPDRVISAGGDIDRRRWRLKFRGAGAAMSTWESRDPEVVDWANGAVMMFRSQMLHDIGLFDEHLCFNFEDAEICVRAADHGWLTLVTYGAKAWQSSSSRPPYVRARAQIEWLRRGPKRRLVFYRWMHLVGTGVSRLIWPTEHISRGAAAARLLAAADVALRQPPRWKPQSW